MTEALRLGTRGSKLAITQSGLVARAVTEATGVPVELVVVRTRGDRIQDRPLPEVGGKGLFTAELEAALQGGEIDLAVHSLKDLPTEDAPGLCLGAIPERADPRDALVGCRLLDLAQGAVVGTGSLRRRVQLLAMRPDLEVRGIRGNVDTRLAKRDRGDYRAIVLAMAGITRLGIGRDDVYPLAVDEVTPAPGQGALAVQCRAGDARVLDLLSTVDHPPTRRRVAVERSFLKFLGGGCNVPAGCHAREVEGGALEATAVVADERGSLAREYGRGDDPIELGRRLALELRRIVRA